MRCVVQKSLPGSDFRPPTRQAAPWGPTVSSTFHTLKYHLNTLPSHTTAVYAYSGASVVVTSNLFSILLCRCLDAVMCVAQWLVVTLIPEQRVIWSCHWYDVVNAVCHLVTLGTLWVLPAVLLAVLLPSVAIAPLG